MSHQITNLICCKPVALLERVRNTQKDSQKYSVKLKKYSLTSLGDFFRLMQHKTTLTFPAEKEEDANSNKNQEQDTTNDSTYYRTGI